MSTETAYEMLWDCRYCGKKKLLGFTHRCCPNCGAPQNAEGRYFPSDADKVLAKDHEYHGADLVCGHCREANGRNQNNCRGCGAPLTGAQAVGLRQETGTPGTLPGAAVAPLRGPDAGSKRKRGCMWLAGIGCLGLLGVVAVLITLALVKHDDRFVVSGHSWRREIAIEQYGAVTDSEWCDDMPAGARSVRKSREVRSHRQVQDGQDCHTKRIDRGNGTFVEQQECTPRYRQEDVYDDKCTFTVDRWKKVRSADTSGNSLTDAPRWADTPLARSGDCEGCERIGERKETYTVELTSPNGKKQTCEFDPTKWASFKDGARFKGKVRMLGDSLDCTSLTPE